MFMFLDLIDNKFICYIIFNIFQHMFQRVELTNYIMIQTNHVMMFRYIILFLISI